MTVIPPLRSAALVLMQQNVAIKASELARHGPADAILAAMSENDGNATASGAGTGQASAALSESIFSVNHKSVTEMKLDLIERTGKALGVDIDDYTSTEDYAAAMRKVVREIRAKPGGDMALRAIERDLGLDKLGVTIDDVIAAASDPDGDAGGKLEKALAAEYGLDEGESDEAAPSVILVQTDDAGLYGVASA